MRQRLWTITEIGYGSQREGTIVRIPTDRPPTHPGETLLEEFLKPLGPTQRERSQAIRVPYRRVNSWSTGAEE
jgi:hypothetical protein